MVYDIKYDSGHQ